MITSDWEKIIGKFGCGDCRKREKDCWTLEQGVFAVCRERTVEYLGGF